MSSSKNEASGKKRIESKYNPSELRGAIQENLTSEQIMERLNINSKQTLRKHVLRLMNDDETYYKIKNMNDRSGNPSVHKQGILRLNLSGVVLDGKEVVSGDLFEMKIEEDKIILTRVD